MCVCVRERERERERARESERERERERERDRFQDEHVGASFLKAFFTCWFIERLFGFSLL